MSQSVDRSMQVLWSVAEGPRTVAALANELGVHTTTALRLVHALRQARLVEQTASGEVRLGAGLIDLGQRALEEHDVRDVARPYMQELSRLTGETINLAVLGEQQVVYVAKIDSTRPTRIYSRVGRVAPLHCTGVTKAILAFLDPAQLEELLPLVTYERFNEHTLVTPEALRADLAVSRERGYALDDREHEEDIHCVAAPILQAGGGVAASLSIAAMTARVSRDDLLALAEPLMAATTAASRDLGYRAPR
jgi:DNA-binding IclR family transcriptional regulator